MDNLVKNVGVSRRCGLQSVAADCSHNCGCAVITQAKIIIKTPHENIEFIAFTLIQVQSLFTLVLCVLALLLKLDSIFGAPEPLQPIGN